MTLEERLRKAYAGGELDFPLPAGGQTANRHRSLLELARSDLSLARLAEAHVDAIAILAEAGCAPLPGVYGVWAAETAGLSLRLQEDSHGISLTGQKMFCSGAGLIDRALVAVEGSLADVSLKEIPNSLIVDDSAWITCAFAETRTAKVTFVNTPVPRIVGNHNWYLDRVGFWHGACGPAACWAGGAIGLVDYALSQSRDDPHTLAHLAAMSASTWSMRSVLNSAGDEIDRKPRDTSAALITALTVRHLIEAAASDILQRLGRSFGPRILAFDRNTSRRYQEVELYIRQSHAERDLELLGKKLRERRTSLNCAVNANGNSTPLTSL